MHRFTAAILLLASPAFGRGGGVRPPRSEFSISALILSKRAQLTEIEVFLRANGLNRTTGPLPEPESKDSSMRFSLNETPYMLGGIESDRFPRVGLIRKLRQAHCTGTVVGKHTILTAAHCIAGSDATDLQKPAELDFVLGRAPDPSADGFRIVKLTPHKDYRLVSDPFLLQNDIGIIEVDGELPLLGSALATPAGDLTAQLDGALLDFVGYGLSSVDSIVGGSGGGVRREVALTVRCQPYTLRYGTTSKSTCSGDSGGPAILSRPGQTPVIVGVTSYVENWLCRSGAVDARVDVIHAWLTPLIH